MTRIPVLPQMHLSIALVFCLASLAACAGKTPSSTCNDTTDCPAGDVCRDQACFTLCSDHSQCDTDETCDDGAGVCVPLSSGAPPIVDAIVGNDSADETKVRDGLIVRGRNLDGAGFVLSGPIAPTNLQARRHTDTVAELVFPANIRAGSYSLSVANQSGSVLKQLALELPDFDGMEILSRLNDNGQTSGTLILDRLPIGDTSSDVARGDHSHDAAYYPRAEADSTFYSRSEADDTFVTHTSPALVPPGAIIPFAVGTPPAGYLRCDGSIVARSEYPGLFGVIGEAYGAGDGATTFALPDYRGLFLRGWDNGAGVDPDAASRIDRGDGMSGDEVGTTQLDDFESHTHGIRQNANGTSAAGTGAAKGDNAWSTDDNLQTGTTYGNGSGLETRPKNVSVMYCIKT